MSSDTITREERPTDDLIPPLDPTLFNLSDAQLRFLHKAISPDDNELKKRIFKVQEESYKVYPYPCIKMFHFVWLMMRDNPIYAQVVEAGKSGNTIFLDIGCMMGTDVRNLVQDGYPASQVLGTDLRREYIDTGLNDLYRDADTCPIHFFSSDIFEVPLLSSAKSTTPLHKITKLEQLVERVNHIYTGALFHLFDERTQFAIALRVGTLLNRKEGGVIFGRHQGREEEGVIPDVMERLRYAHSPKSWATMWTQVFTQLESEEFAKKKLKVEATLSNAFQVGSNKAVMLVWSVQIISN